MRENKSEIFEAYAKLAEEKGLIKTAAEDKKTKKDKESPELKKYKDEAYARVGSDEISIIEALYGVKPKASPGMEYDGNISQFAHPNAVVVGPSYDKLNALVENINERQNIIINKIRSAPPSGSVFLLKDAEKDLTMELIRIGNDMDNADQDELRLLADECLEDLKRTAGLWDDVADYAHKAVNYLGGHSGERAMGDAVGVGEGALAGAGAGALIGAVITSWGGPLSFAGAGVGGLLGGIAGGLIGYIGNTSPKVKNIKENSKDLLEKMKSLKEDVPEEADYFTTAESFIEKLVQAADNYIWMLNIVQQKTMKNEPVLPNESEEVKKDSKVFIDMITTFETIKKTFEDKVKLGVFSKSLTSIPHPGIASNVDKITKSFDSLATAIELLKSQMDGVVTKAVSDVKKQESKKDEPKKEEVKAPEAKKEEQSPQNMKKVFDLIGYKPDEKTMNFFNSLPDFK